MPLLFAYGTLQRDDVQLALFGRLLAGRQDVLPAFSVALIVIDDLDVVAKSGKTHYTIVKHSGREADGVAGMVFEMTDRELTEADAYEVPQYTRVAATLASGQSAWVYADTRSDLTRVTDFATKYTAAWCSQHAASVAAHFAEAGSLQINAASPAVGRSAIAASAQAFMTAFPDMVVAMDAIEMRGHKAVYRWTLSGTNSGPGGTAKTVRFSGHEEWTFGADGLIATSRGYFDEAEYQRQLRAGVGPLAR